ncbi:hypothetical protein M441DRAFT_185515 [Trichoderma asperellum CBS 433.97]|uniref:Uncharacterized protein n=1 Tax=Trichoderma asperellum (strain ATCC 204424 / CBS 433.97 / NBRC 101777) TaxID=1042311 RepID=A0A2T3ZLX4_TRIA4|nr:hypothetical protein M441DRAFT_185515 [Trichoderma asperellum CBS 433.97]PTB45805.1 hypothetical protein M441DRAFT_185515 [Trichoderma asperellum CBS 433.97]
MSSSAQPAGPLPKADRERKGIVKVFAKVKGVLRRTGTERQPSAAAGTSAGGVVATTTTTPGAKTEDAPKLYVWR